MRGLVELNAGSETISYSVLEEVDTLTKQMQALVSAADFDCLSCLGRYLAQRSSHAKWCLCTYQKILTLEHVRRVILYRLSGQNCVPNVEKIMRMKLFFVIMLASCALGAATAPVDSGGAFDQISNSETLLSEDSAATADPLHLPTLTTINGSPFFVEPAAGGVGGGSCPVIMLDIHTTEPSDYACELTAMGYCGQLFCYLYDPGSQSCSFTCNPNS